MYWSYRWAKFVSSSSRSNNASTLIVLDAMSSTTLLQTVIEKLLAWYSQGRDKTNASRSNHALTHIVLTPILWCHVFNNVARAVVGMIESKSWQDELVKVKQFLNTDCACSYLVVPPRLQQQHYEQCSNSCCDDRAKVVTRQAHQRQKMLQHRLWLLSSCDPTTSTASLWTVLERLLLR